MTTAFRTFGAVLTNIAVALTLKGQDLARAEFANFDKRRDAAGNAVPLPAEQATAADRLKERSPGVRIDWDDVLGSPRFILNERAFLTGSDGAEDGLIPGARPDPLAGDPHKAVKQFLNDHSGLFGFDAVILAAARVSREHVTAHNGMRTVMYEQSLDGIPVFEAFLCGHVGRNGELVSLCSQFLPNLAQAADAGVPNRHFVQTFPPVSSQQAVAAAATNVGETLDAANVFARDEPEGPAKRQRLQATALKGDAETSLVWLPMSRQAMRLCWRVVLTGKTRGEMFQVVVDAETGEPQVRHCWTYYANAVAYRVFPSDSPSPFSPGWSTPNTNQPAPASRVLTNLIAISTNASPEGWITPGRSNTIGNNVDAHTDLFDDNRPYADDPPSGNPPRPTGTTNNGVLTFDFPLDLTNSSPTTTDNQKSAQVNAFYWVNWMHDKLYDLGFTEAAGNYQATNFGRGGALSNDAVLVDVQNGNNIYTTNNSRALVNPIDGMPARLELGIFLNPSPDRDGAMDAEWMVHEYTHLMSTRLVGHGAGISALQSFALGEGWSDFFSLSLLAQSGEDTNAAYAWGGYDAYLLPSHAAEGTNLLENYYYGARRYPYTLQMTNNPLTLGDAREFRSHPGIPLSPKISAELVQFPELFRDSHLLGEIWCVALWEARAIYISKYGFTNGTDRILRLVIDGMKLGPANPKFLQARDAILLADRVTTGGVDQTNLWTAFAKRGMGWSAICPASYTTDGMTESFDLPPPDRKLWAFQTGTIINSSPAIGPDGTIYVGSQDSKLYAINPDGTLRWTVSGSYSFDCSPAVGLDGTVYMGANDGYLRAITNGVTKWANYLSGAIFSSPAIGSNGTIYVGVANTAANIVATSPGGTQLWATTLGTFHYVYSSPAIGSNGTVYIGCMDGKLYALNPTNGQIITSNSTGAGIYSSPAIASDGSVYVGSLDGKVYAFDAGLNPKSSPWPFNIGTNIYGSPAISADGIIYIGAENQRLYSLNPDGSLRWSLLTGNKVQSTPAIGADGSVFFGCADWRLYCVATNGTTNWTYTTGFNIFSSPVIGPNGVLYVGSADSKLYALPANTYMAPGAWPCFRRNLRHTANVGTLSLQPGFVFPPDNWGEFRYIFQVHGPAGQTCQVETSGDLVNWVTDFGSFNLDNAGIATYQGVHSGVGFFRVKSGALRSLNAIGSVVLTIPAWPTQILMASQFNTPDNTVRGVLSNVPEGSRLNKWDEATQSYRTNLFTLGRWSDESMSLRPGEGVFFLNSLTQSMLLHLTGEILQGDLSNSIPAEVSVRSSMVPQAGPIQTTLGFTPVAFDVVSLLTNGSFESHTFSGSFWWPSEPSLAVGEAAHIDSETNKLWRQRYFVWP